ncbi:MAG TPA: GntR family transcriptional regulator, partial [bacterium]|nr:GntR family transcriptional regulator [bacterium]
PLYLQIRAEILRQLQEQKFHCLPSETSLCLHYGVSRPTVRKALEVLVRDNFIVRKRGKGSFVQKPVERLPLLNNNILIVIPQGWHLVSGQGYLGQMMEGLFSAARDEHLEFTVTNYSPVAFATRRKEFPSRVCLWISPEQEEKVAMEALAARGYLVVALNRPVKHPQISYVSCDHQSGALAGTEILLQQGHTRVGFVSLVDGHSYLQQRYLGFLAAHRTRGLFPEDEFILHTDYDDQSIKNHLRNLLQQEKPPTGPFLADGAFQEPVLEVLTELKLKVPGDISLVSFDEVQGISEKYGITTIRQPLEEMSRKCIQHVLKAMQQGIPERFQVTLSPELVVRDSVARVR